MLRDSELPPTIISTLAAYREYWNNITPPFECEFVGTTVDIDVLDFIVYEMGCDFPGGIARAGLLLGNVFVHEGGFQWITNDTGNLFVGRRTHPEVRLDPVSRSFEQLASSVPQYNKFARIALEMLCMGPYLPEFLGDCYDVIWPRLRNHLFDYEHDIETEFVGEVLRKCRLEQGRLDAIDTGG